MANPHKGEVEFTSGDKNYVLRWSTNAICELEEGTKRSFNSIIRELATWAPPQGPDGTPLPESDEELQARMDRMKITTVRAVFWAMLRERQERITMQQAGDLMEALGGLPKTLELVNQTFERGNAPETKDARPPNVA